MSLCRKDLPQSAAPSNLDLPIGGWPEHTRLSLRRQLYSPSSSSVCSAGNLVHRMASDNFVTTDEVQFAEGLADFCVRVARSDDVLDAAKIFDFCSVTDAIKNALRHAITMKSARLIRSFN